MPNYLKKLDHAMEIIERNISGYATLAIAVILFVNVVLRSFFHSGLVWGNELSSYLNILSVYAILGIGFKYGAHVGVSAFVDYVVPQPLKKFFTLLTNLCILAFLGVTFYQSIRMAGKQFGQNQVSPVLNIPIGGIYIIVAVGIAFAVIRVIMEIVKLYYKEDSAPASGGKEGE